jgi:plastocyanin
MGGKLRRGVLIAAIGALLAWPALSQAGIGYVYVEAQNHNKFSPETSSYTLLGSPNFEWHWGDGGDTSTLRKHNVRQDDRLFRSGDPTKTFPGGYTVTASAGTYRYYCEVHGGPNGQGMSGRIKVTPIIDGKATTDEFPIRWAIPQDETGDQFDVRYRIDGHRWKFWRKNAAAMSGVFGHNDNPVNLRPATTYDVSVRSERSSNPKHHSAWSPGVSFGTFGKTATAR